MSQYCRTYKKLQGAQKHIKPSKLRSMHNCSNHKSSSSNMESVGAYRIFKRSESSHQLLYTDYYGDGYSKTYETVKNIYNDTTINKFDCIGHIHKRSGTRLRKLKNRTPSVRGKGKLTDKFIDKLQNYYGIAIRSNAGNLENMQTAVISAFYYCCSSSRKLMYEQCLEDKENWCRYQRHLATSPGKKYVETSNHLPKSVINSVKSVYLEFFDQSLLEKCLLGKTQMSYSMELFGP
ncbi:hypothetical protein AVEN_49318-1 [Araneus ventricosus]|uniref:Mutator-like transposase domain-containing protein n=1 Tax=Araneus ventricosus TaxID=182803 RepID=A0A4Y2WXM7_ARAVE|nr:hypothetical protein AVEN_232174-1 [Araneus ventricosus]GBO41275.1 hypothetical protein AVEN_49318-1 [Araneus ventricosus]